jgi:predicted GNAT family N-acyltransferase
MMTEYSIQFADWKEDKELLTALRHQVFVGEQKVPVEIEIDDMDSQCQHIKACLEDKQIIGTARLLPDNYIGRMCVAKEYRRQGIAGAMLEFIIQHARHQNFKSLHLNAQISAQPLYESYGFVADSDIFMEAGIPHRHMSLPLNT